MKKILLVVTLIASFGASFAQGNMPVNQPIGSINSENYTNGLAGATYGYRFRVSAADTAALNLLYGGVIKTIPGVLARCVNDLYLRSNDASQWIKLASGTISTNYWSKTGDAGTVAGTNFIGSTDSVDFVGKTKSLERFRWNARGAFAVGTGTDYGTSGYFLKSNGVTTAPVWSLPTNIYTSDGTLTGDRVVTQNNHTIEFTGGYFGIGKAPAYDLDVLGTGSGLFTANIANNDINGKGLRLYVDHQSQTYPVLEVNNSAAVLFDVRGNGDVNIPLLSSGASTDSLVTWNATTKTIHKIPPTSIVTSTPTLQLVTNAGATTTNSISINGNVNTASYLLVGNSNAGTSSLSRLEVQDDVDISLVAYGTNYTGKGGVVGVYSDDAYTRMEFQTPINIPFHFRNTTGTNAKVGINTAAPDSNLHVLGGILGTGGVRFSALPLNQTYYKTVRAKSDGTLFLSDTTAGSGISPSSGTLNYVPKWTPNGTTLGNSQIFDSGDSVQIGTGTAPYQSGFGTPILEVIKNQNATTALRVDNATDGTASRVGVIIQGNATTTPAVNAKYGAFMINAPSYTGVAGWADRTVLFSGGLVTGGLLAYADDGPIQLSVTAHDNPDLWIAPLSINGVVQTSPVPGYIGIGTKTPSTQVEINKSQNSSTLLSILNPTNNTAAYAGILIGESSSSGHYSQFTHISRNYTTALGWLAAGATVVRSGGDGELNLVNSGNNGVSFWVDNNTGTWFNPFKVSAAGNLISGTDNTYDIGASGATRPRTGYFGTSLVSPTVSATGQSTTIAPITITSGTVKTTATTGTIEYNGSFYQTKASGLRYGLGGKIFNSSTTVPNVTTTETDLYTNTLPASILATDNETVKAAYSVTTVGSATATTQCRLYFGGTLIYDSGALGLSLATDFRYTVEVIRESSTVVRCSVTSATTTATAAPYTVYTRITGLTLSNTQILKITGTRAGVGAASGDINSVMSSGEWQAAAGL